MIRALLALLLLSAFSQDQKVSLTEIGVVRTQFVTSDHWAFRGHEVAKAMRTADGQQWVLINVDADQSEFASWYLHEIAHLIAWERYGEKIQTHGPEFRRICRQLITHRANYFCKGN